MHSNNFVVQRSGTFGGMGLTQEGWPARSRPSCLLHPADLCQSHADQGCSRTESRTNHAGGTDTELRCGRCQRGARRLRCTRNAVPPDPAALMEGEPHEGVSAARPCPHERRRCSSRSIFLRNRDLVAERGGIRRLVVAGPMPSLSGGRLDGGRLTDWSHNQAAFRHTFACSWIVPTKHTPR